MRTRTIFEAHQLAAYDYRIGSYAQPPKPSKLRRRRSRQIETFAAELLRRMDERDALVTQNTRILGNLQIAWQNNAELARRLYAPKDDGK